jgi:fatty acid desaturase
MVTNAIAKVTSNLALDPCLPGQERTLNTTARASLRVDSLRAAWAIGRQWIVIAAAVWLAFEVQHWAVWVLAAAVIVTRQMSLLVLMHEAAHHHLFANRRWSELVSDLLCAFPMHITTAGFRQQHLQHHRSTNTPADPYWMSSQRDPGTWHYPQRPRSVLRIFAFDLLGLHLPRWLRIASPWTYFYRLGSRDRSRMKGGEHLYPVFLAALITLLIFTNAWIPYLLLWIAPWFTIGMALFRMRALGEHPMGPADPPGSVNHVEGTWLERHSIAPLNINYHIEHHQYPWVPYYHLPAVIGDRGGHRCYRTYLGLRDGVLGDLLGRESTHERSN